MRRRLYRLLAAFLLAALPWQGFVGATMLSCAHAAATAQPGGAPCHESAAPEQQGSGHEALADLGEWSACSGCAQCHACSASALPTTVEDPPVSSPLQPVFTPPAAIAGVVLEHADPPPVG